ncbi:hypothetical protein D3C80_1576140 [compost metagenome]
MAALPAGHPQVQGPLWIVSAVEVRQAVFIGAAEGALQAQQLLKGRLQRVITLQRPRQLCLCMPIMGIGNGAVIDVQYVPGRLGIKQLQVGGGPVEPFRRGQPEVPRQVLVGLGLGRHLPGVVQGQQQLSPGQAMGGVLLYIGP